MSFIGVDPDRMRELASLADDISTGASDVATRASTIISTHQLEDLAGNTTGLLDNVQTEMTNLSELAQTKAADIELAANGGIAAFCLPWPIPCKKESKEESLEKIRGDINDDNDEEMSATELKAVLRRLENLSEEDRAWVIDSLTDQELDRLLKNVESDHGIPILGWRGGERVAFYDLIAKLPPGQQARIGQLNPTIAKVLEALARTNGDPEANDALRNLLRSGGYAKTSADQRIALLSQVINYPNKKSIYNLERLAAKEWARDFDLDDFQRSAKLVAYLSQYPDGDRRLNDNTLDSFLADCAPYRFDWEATGGYGSADQQVFHLNPDYLSAGDEPVEKSVPTGRDWSDTLHLVTHTVAHEVNHCRNRDRVSQSYDYFMGEYRGFYVGFVAEHGRPPTRAEVRDRVDFLLTSSDPTNVYTQIAKALKDPTEGPKIAKFVSQMLGKDVPPDQVVDALRDLKAGLDADAPEPVSVDGGPNNLDNAP